MKIKRLRRKGGRPSTQPRPVGQVVDFTFRWLKLDDHARSYRTMRAFSIAAGPRIGEHARAERLRGSILYVRCDSSAWSQHLHVMKAQLVERIAKTPGGEDVKEIRFNVGPLDEVAGWEAPLRAAAAEAPEVAHALPEEIARALGDVDDPELRDRLAGLYGKLGSKEPTKK